jgi:hypothetical protein
MNSGDLETFKVLISTFTLPDLGPGPRPGVQSVSELTEKMDHFFADRRLPREQEQALRSAGLLWHDHLDESHHLSQILNDQNGSFLHGIMHRREPDYRNAEYWFRQVGEHPAFPEIAGQARSLLSRSGEKHSLSSKLFRGAQWSPYGFIAACQDCALRGADDSQSKLLQEIQAIEFNVLLTHL